MNLQYNTLLKSVGMTTQAAESIHKDRDTMTRFIGYLTQNETEITKFGKATDEVCEYLNKYDFVKGYQFESMQKKLVLLHPLRMKLAKMGEEAKKLTVLPDRYDSKRAIEICRGLALTCMERMSLAEIGKVEDLVETNTKKLIDIQHLFERDKNILEQINAILESNNSILSKCKAYQNELKQYVSEFPHQGSDDLEFVKSRIATAKQMVDLWGTVDKAIEGIRDYADRHNKSALIDKYSQIVVGLSSKMHYADVGNYKTQLNGVLQDVRALDDAFEKDCDELKTFQNSLKQKKADIWKEDNERLLSKVSAILNSDSKKASFDMGKLKTEHVTAKQKRIDDIDATLKKYRWLGNSRRYKSSHDALKTKYITSTEYQTSVELIRKERRKRLLCIPIPGWIILIFEYVKTDMS